MSRSEELQRIEHLRNADTPNAQEIDGVRVAVLYDDEGQVSLLDVLLVIARNRKLIWITAALFGFIGLLVAVLPETPEYPASATVIREGSGSEANGPGAIMGRFGGVGASSIGLTAHIYPDILASREVRLGVIRDTFYVSRWDTSIRLVEYLNQPAGRWEAFLQALKQYTLDLPKTIKRELGEGPTLARSTAPPSSSAAADFSIASAGSSRMPSVTAEEELALTRISELIATSVDRDTGLMSIASTTEDPQLSADVVSSFIRNLQERVRTLQTEKAQQDLDFIRDRFRKAEDDLRVAEEELADFMDRNNSLTSARLQTELERLRRTLQFKINRYSAFQSQMAEAELELQRRKPVITVLQHPVPPLWPVGSSPGTTVLISVFLGLLIGAVLAFGRAFVEKKQSNEDERQKVNEIRQALVPRVLLNPIWGRKHNGTHRPNDI